MTPLHKGIGNVSHRSGQQIVEGLWIRAGGCRCCGEEAAATNTSRGCVNLGKQAKAGY